MQAHFAGVEAPRVRILLPPWSGCLGVMDGAVQAGPCASRECGGCNLLLATATVDRYQHGADACVSARAQMQDWRTVEWIVSWVACGLFALLAILSLFRAFATCCGRSKY